MSELNSKQHWWNLLEPQWQQALCEAVFSNAGEQDPARLDALQSLQTIRLAGPTAPFPNVSFELTNLSGLQFLPCLSIVIIIHHKIENIEVLQGLTNFKSLFLTNNVITSLKGIEDITGLEQLYVQSNQINSIKPIERLVNLKEFYINDNCIDSLDGLTEAHAELLNKFICKPNPMLKQKEIIRVERELGIICRSA